MKVCKVEEMKTLDEIASSVFGISSDILMENAGLSVYHVITNQMKVKGKKFLIFCGPGNNGGDGFVVGRLLHSHHGDVKIHLLADKQKLKGSAKKNFEIISKLNIKYSINEKISNIKRDLFNSDLIIDALFGTGLTREIKGKYRQIIKLINESKKPVHSIDIPSGIHGDNGKVLGVAVKADTTTTLGIPKIGNILYPGFEYCGELYVSHISFPPQLYNNVRVELNEPLPIPDRKVDGHKGSFGDVLFIAGSTGYYGAPYFAAMSFLKAGGGYSRLATSCSLIPWIATKGSEIVFIPLKETDAGSLSLKNSSILINLAKKADMIVIGPGLSVNKETQQLIQEVVSVLNKPLVIDGDGLTAISHNLETIQGKNKVVLTPHLGEMAKITKQSVKKIEKNKVDILRQTSQELGSIIVLKGAHTLIGFPNTDIVVNLSGNCGMATAGSGDILTGTIAAMFGLGLGLKEAVRVGVFIHGLAGDLAAESIGQDGVTAGNIMNYLPLTMNYYRENLETIKEEYSIEII